MIKYILVTDKGRASIPEHPERLVMSATDFILHNNMDATGSLRKHSRVKVINLCSNFDYLSKGYYCSLLAEARGLRCIPSVSNIIMMNWKRNYQSSLPDINALLEKHFDEPGDEPLARSYLVYFGRTEVAKLEPIARHLFDLFRFPLMEVTLRYGRGWTLESVEPVAFGDLPPEKLSVFTNFLDRFTGTAWAKPSVASKKEKHWIAILHDPAEKMAPSNKAALAKFVKIGKDMNLYVEMIQKTDFSSLLEFDALFIRETTSINNHTFRFALKAESEDIPCIDDTQSIIRCCNKVFLHELLEANGVPVPKALFLDRRRLGLQEKTLDYPMVVKIPDGAFSRGVMKVTDAASMHKAAQQLFKSSDIILAQEFVSSEFDWRIGVLDGKALYACKYYMVKGHWQIYSHNGKTGTVKDGQHETVPIEAVPADVLDVAVRAARLVGSGFYGVDLKETAHGPVVMEINDNPSIDHGVEDQVLGDGLYRAILEHLVKMIEA